MAHKESTTKALALIEPEAIDSKFAGSHDTFGISYFSLAQYSKPQTKRCVAFWSQKKLKFQLSVARLMEC